MEKLRANVREWERRRIIGAAVVVVCALGIIALLGPYFRAYHRPYLMGEIIDLSAGWQYQVDDGEPWPLESLRSGPKLRAGETLTLSRELAEELPQAAVLIRANHQTVGVWLDGVPLHLDEETGPGQNPGMALHFIPLPGDYAGGTLTVRITSPYTAYAGRTSPILLGSVQSLEAYALSASMRSVILMAMCLLLGLCTIGLALAQALGGTPRWDHFAIGVFAVVWALYYVCTEYIVFQFFSPVMVSRISLGLYYSFAAPLTLYFYCSFRRFKKWMRPAVIIQAAFTATALSLQLAGLVDLPRLLHLNNVLLAGLAWTMALAALEAWKGGGMMHLSALFLAVAYGSMLWNFHVFYGRQGVVPYTYKDTYFLLVLCILAAGIQQFFSRYYRERREGEVLALQARLAQESYDQIVSHLEETGGLRHEMHKHLAALGTYLNDGRAEEAAAYLSNVAGQAEAVGEAVYHPHILINAVVAGLEREARERGIKTELHLSAAPQSIEAPDLYSLLTNMLENAVEACAAMPQDRERYIRFTISRREPYLNFICENSHGGNIRAVGEELRTTKPGDGHGYGLRVIRRIAARYDGLVDIDYDRDTFTLTVALKDN